MKQKIYTTLLAIAVVATAQLSYAQSYVKQVIVLNQGPFAAAPGVTIGSYDPVAKTYQNFDTIPNAAFASDVIIDSGYIYVAADSFLIKYDLNTKQRVATQVVQGIREIAVWGNELLVTLGQYYKLPNYFQAYSKSSLNLLYSLPSVSNATEGIKVLHDTAYVAINGFFGTVGSLGVIDLNKAQENREIDLGANALDPFNVEMEPATKHIFTVNSPGKATSVTKYDVGSGTFANTILNSGSACGGSTYFANNIFFQTLSDTAVLGEFSTAQLLLWDSLFINKSLYGIAVDSVNGLLYLGTTNYTTYGKVFVYNFYGEAVDSFDVDVSPSNFAFDVRSTTGINQVSSFANLVMYPNPVSEQLRVALIDSKDAGATISLVDILGRQVYQQQIPTNASEIVPMNSLSPGIYFLKAETNSGELTKKIVKE